MHALARSFTLFSLALLLATCGGGGPSGNQTRIADLAGLLAKISNARNITEISALTAPADGIFSFVVIGDNRSGDAVLSRLAAQINAYTTASSGTAKPLFVLHTGDIVPSGTTSEWENYAQLRALVKLPVVYVRGNHEIAASTGAQNYEQIVGPLDWTFDFGGCRFIGLDNATDQFSQTSVDFLRGQLGLASPDGAGGGTCADMPQHRFVVIHEPPAVGRWTVHSMAPDAQGGRGGDVMAAITQGGVSAVFIGHLHLFDEMKIDGIPYLVSGGAGAPLASNYGFGNAEYGFLVVHVKPDLPITWDWVPLS